VSAFAAEQGTDMYIRMALPFSPVESKAETIKIGHVPGREKIPAKDARAKKQERGCGKTRKEWGVEGAGR